MFDLISDGPSAVIFLCALIAAIAAYVSANRQSAAEAERDELQRRIAEATTMNNKLTSKVVDLSEQNVLLSERNNALQTGEGSYAYVTMKELYGQLRNPILVVRGENRLRGVQVELIDESLDEKSSQAIESPNEISGDPYQFSRIATFEKEFVSPGEYDLEVEFWDSLYVHEERHLTWIVRTLSGSSRGTIILFK